MFSLSEEQAYIRDFGTGNLVIVAGAGTGKTETLTQRVLKLLLEGNGSGPAELGEVLALTFTDKAAGEMRQRVYQGILARRQATQDTHERRRLDQLRAAFVDENRISTFDAFNYWLVSLYPERGLLPPGFEMMTDFDKRELFGQLARAFWDYVEAADGAVQERLLQSLIHFPRRRDFLEQVDRLAHLPWSQLEAMAIEATPEEDESRLRDLEEAAHEAVERRQERIGRRLWQRYFKSLPNQLPPPIYAQISDPDAVLINTTQAGAWTKKWEKNLTPAEIELLEPCMAPLARWRKWQKEAEDELENFYLSSARMEQDLASLRVSRAMASFALWWKDKRRELCRRKRLVDFDDIREAAHTLLTEPEVASRLRRSFAHILVDEFQDTDITQWRALDQMRREDNVLIVGDGKQAIYHFRGGDITVFDEVSGVLLQERDPAQLSISRRSVPAIVDWCNQVFAEVLPPPDDREPFEAPFHPLEAAPGRAGGGVWLLPPARPTEGPVVAASQTEAGRKLCAAATAAFLRELSEDAELIRRGQQTQLKRPDFESVSRALAANEEAVVALLFRTHTVKDLYEAALQLEGVPYASVKGRGFFQSDEALQALNLLRFFENAEDDLALVGLLRSPLGGFSDTGLLELKLAGDGPLWQILQSVELEDPASAHARSIILPRLDRWRRLAAVQPVSEVFETVHEESEMSYWDAGYPDAEQRGANRRKVIDILRERESRGQGSPRRLAEFFASQLANAPDEAEAALPEGGSIQLMTVHAAKGLGFPLTILAQMDDVPHNDSPAVALGHYPSRDDAVLAFKSVEIPGTDVSETEKVRPLLWEILNAEEQARRAAEFRRLFYVACTRAKEHLILVWPNEPKTGSWADLCADHIDDLRTINPQSPQTLAPHSQTS